MCRVTLHSVLVVFSFCSDMWRNFLPIVAGKVPQTVLLPVGPDEINSYLVQVGPRVAREVRERDGDCEVTVPTAVRSLL